MSLFQTLGKKLFFSQMTSILKIGSQRSLQAEDLPQLPDFLDPETVVLNESRINWKGGREILRSLIAVSSPLWISALLLYFLFGFMNLLGPVLVNLFIKNASHGFSTNHQLVSGLLYGLGVGLVGLIGGLSLQHYFFRNLAWQQVVINVVNKHIFRQALALHKEAREATPIGDIVNHMSADTDSLAEFGGAVADLCYSILMLVGTIGLLFYYLGSTAWVAVVLLGCLAPLTRKVSQAFIKYDEDLMKWRDQRVTLMAQVLSAIRLVKSFVWEKSVALEVSEVRERELESRRKIAKTQMLVTLLYVSVGTLVLFFVFAVHSWRGGSFDAALVFTCVSLFALLEDPFANISRVISTVIAAKVAGDRISKFLSLETKVQRAQSGRAALGAVGFEMKGFSLSYGNSAHLALDKVNLRVQAGTSLAVIGSVGSGKSTFIHALLGELEKSGGQLTYIDESGQCVDDFRLGLVPQEAFILNGTLRENICFGREGVSEDEVLRSLELSCLDTDIALMPGGLDSEIGERGINLSGGQKQRLSLARAVLHKPQLLLLDDPLSAVDGHTETLLAERLLFGEWKSTTLVMITHRLSQLEKFDQVAFLEKGRLVAAGRFSELKQRSPAFRSYLEEYARTHDGRGTEKSLPTVSLAKNTESSRLTEDEDRNQGSVESTMYSDYVLSLGGRNKRTRPLILLLLLLAAACSTLLPLIQKSWLAFSSNIQSGDQEGLSLMSSWARQADVAIYVYGLLGLIVLIGTLWADMYWLKRGLAAGRMIHHQMLQSVLGAGVRFFDSTPVGRTLQRFSRDMEAIDIHLQWSFEHSLKCFTQVLLTLILIVSVLPLVGLFIGPVLLLYYQVQKVYRASAREVKRLDSVSRSPRYAHFKETLQGLSSIRAFSRGEWFLNEFYKRLRHNQRMFYGHYMINRWFSSRIPAIGGLVAMATTLGIIFAVRAGSLSPGMAGLLTVYSLSFWGVLNWGIRVWAEVEARMTSMERVKHFMNLPQEPLVALKGEVPPEWPSRGEVTFENVVARYIPNKPAVLKGLSFRATAGSRLGIIGRTGSGKSTILQALYRFIDVEEGRILIDGVDIASVPLPRLRRALAIIPQDPVLFMGTLRSNLDRYDEHTDQAIWDVLDRTSLGEFVRAQPQGVLTQIVENGANLSQGQRQLLCLARALLVEAKIIVLDEATASVDVKTDAVVQRVLRESCSGRTMLIIAHRLGTLQDCDQILELSEGHSVNQCPRENMAEA